MEHNSKHALLRPKGVLAVASRSLNDPLPCQCFLKINVNEVDREANVQLIFPLPTNDSEPRDVRDSHVTFIYDGDNIIPGTGKVGTVGKISPQWSSLKRRANSTLSSVTFSLHHPATFLCPLTFRRDTSVPYIQQLEALALSTSVSIIFDFNGWVHPDKRSQFYALITRKSQFSSYPRSKTSPFLREVEHWSSIPTNDPIPEPVLHKDADIQETSPVYVNEPPPSYTPRPLKRSRHSLSPPFHARLTKPAAEPPSPTDKATTTTATPSPKRSAGLSPPPFSPLRVPEDVIESAIAKQLPEIIAGMLSRQDTSTQSSQYRHNCRMLADGLKEHIKEALAEQVSELHEEYDAETRETLDDQKHELNIMAEDQYLDLERDYHEKIDEFKEHTTEIVRTLEEDAEGVYLEVNAKMEDLGSEKMAEMRHHLAKESKRLSKKLKRLSRKSKRVETEQRILDASKELQRLEECVRRERLLLERTIKERVEIQTTELQVADRGHRASSLPVTSRIYA